MTPQQAMQQLAPLGMAVVDELKLIGEQNSCIFAGALLTKVLHRKGFPKAYPLTVRAKILNPPLTEWTKVNGFDLDGSREKEWSALGGLGISLGGGSRDLVPENKWFGHLAVIVPNHFDDRHGMFDVTVTQCHKPEWGINLVPVIARVPDPFVRGEASFKPSANGSLIVYFGFPDDHSYRDTNLWKDQARYDPIADRVLARLG